MPKTPTRTAPTFCIPMQPRQVAELPTGPDWLYEIKWDGFRCLAMKHGRDVRLVSRNEKDLTRQFPTVADALSRITAKAAILDGEIIALDDSGRPSFQALQNRKTEDHRIAFFAFDLLHLDGVDMRETALEKRKAKLEKVVGQSGLMLSKELIGDVGNIINEARKLGLEGIVAKRRAGRYVCGESGDWVKLKLNREQEFVVGGYSPPLNSPHALVLGYYEGPKLICCGRVRNGFNALSRGKLVPLLTMERTDVCPFANLPMDKHGSWGEGITRADMEDLRWVKPTIVVQVAFVEWTRAGLLRHPTYRGIREDKRARDVRRE